MTCRTPRRALLRTAMILCLVAVAATANAKQDHPTLVDELGRIEMLGLLPGVSSSAAAGLLNPATWSLQRSGGLYLGWEDLEGDPYPGQDYTDFTGVANFRNLGFGLRYRGLGEAAHYAYTLGFAGGDRDQSTGLSYTWTRGAEASFGDAQRLSFGSVHRWRMASLGTTASYDFVSEDALYQADLGFRPFGPRLTLFGGAAFVDPSVDYEGVDDVAFSYGLEARILPGFDLSALARDTGELSLRIDLAWGESGGIREPARAVAGARVHLDDEQEHAATTYAFETGVGPHLGLLFARPTQYPEMDLRGAVAYRGYRFFDHRQRLLTLMNTLADDAVDPRVAGVVINLSDMRSTPANYWELRAQLAGLRAAGKRVIIYFDRASLPLYMLATVADELWMDPQGDLDIKGLAFGRTYYRRMLDKMGVGIDEWRFFTYKSAMEGYSRTSMSEADREQFQVFMEDWYEAAVGLVLEARGIDRATWDGLVNGKAELIPSEALAAGLVDRVGDYHEARDKAGETKTRRSPDSVKADLASLQGEPVWGPESWGEPPRIALLYAIGPCEMDSGIEGRRLSGTIRRVRDDERVKAVVLRADSPGGDPLPSDLVSRELKTTMDKKPVMVSQGQVAASGGYWISMHSDKIFASPFTLTGSIGVISGHIWDNGLGEKIGMDYDQVQIGQHADYQSGPALPLIGVRIPHRPVTAEERARAESVMKTLYGDFTEQVAEGRHMTPQAVDAIGQGRIWSGEDGLGNGLVDGIDGLWGSLLAAKRAAGVPDDRPVTIVEGPELGLFDPGMFTPDLPGLNLRATLDADAPTRLLSGAPWDQLPTSERDYLERIFTANGAPAVMMPPLAVEGATLTP